MAREARAGRDAVSVMRWTPQRRAKFVATMAAKRKPVTQTCQTCPRLLTNVDVQHGCVRCHECRKGTPFNTPVGRLTIPAASGSSSWWAEPAVQHDRAAFSARALAEAPRMGESKEAHQLGMRKEIGA